MSESIKKILFVCTGNSCRSPMAEGILKKMFVNHGIDHVTVESAGTMVPRGILPANNGVLTSLENGIDITKHRSRQLTRDMVEKADLILVMEEGHLNQVKRLSSSTSNKLFLLKGYGLCDSEAQEVKDPIGFDLDVYRTCFEELHHEIKRIFPLILKKFDIL